MLAGSQQKLGGGLDRVSLTSSEGTHPAHTLISDLQPPALGDDTFLLFKLRGLWGFVTVAPGN